MTLQEQFTAAQERVKTLTRRPSNDELLSLYALYKQGSGGDVTGKRPGLFDLKGRAKFDAWQKVQGVTADAAMQRYVALVDKLMAG